MLGIIGGLALARGVLARPATKLLSGPTPWWGLVWRGVVYGLADGLLLLAFPWLVVWLPVLLVTTTYQLEHCDFRSARVLQPNLGSSIGLVPTLVSATPVASPISHVLLHVTAVLHSPGTDFFLPPHRE